MNLADAIRELHFPVVIKTYSGPRTMCDHCDTGDPYCTVSFDWPCPTVEIVERFQ